jgi:hypothetical protein
MIKCLLSYNYCPLTKLIYIPFKLFPVLIYGPFVSNKIDILWNGLCFNAYLTKLIYF